jgi:hypothetical protein
MFMLCKAPSACAVGGCQTSVSCALPLFHGVVLYAGVWEFMTSKEALHLVADRETPEEACRVVSAH